MKNVSNGSLCEYSDFKSYGMKIRTIWQIFRLLSRLCSYNTIKCVNVRDSQFDKWVTICLFVAF